MTSWWSNPTSSTTIYYDSEATLAYLMSKMYSGKSWHIGLRHNYIKQLLRDGVISVTYVKSIENLADPLTKGPARDKIYKISKIMEHWSIV